MSRFVFNLASVDDDEQLRVRMAADCMDGPVTVSFRREPSFFHACSVFGKRADVIKCTETDSGTIVGLGTRACFDAWINGEVRPHGYLSDLRGHLDYRRGTLLARGYRFLGALHHADPVPQYDSLVLDGNDAVRRLLERPRPTLPAYHYRGRIHSPAILLAMRKPARIHTGLSVRRACSADIPNLVAFHQREAAIKQFAPVWREEDFGTMRMRGLRTDDIYLAISGREIVGMAAAWDQSRFRQNHVESYHGLLKLVRPFYNALSRVTRFKPLPAPGQAIPSFYLALVAIRDNDPAIFSYLLRAIYCDRLNGPWHYMIPCFHERDPLREVLGEYPSIEAGGHLYTVRFPLASGEARYAEPDNRIPCVELATK